MYSGTGDTTSLAPGFPIRTSSDPRSVGSSPRHIAASHVLHRLSVPRHPPCALKHLQHKTKKMSHHPHTTPTPERADTMCGYQKNLHYIQEHNPKKAVPLDARNHYPQIKHHTPPPKQGNNTPTPPTQSHPRQGHGLVVSKPNSVSGSHSRPGIEPPKGSSRPGQLLVV